MLPKLSGKSGSGLLTDTTSGLGVGEEGVMVRREGTVGVGVWGCVGSGEGKTVRVKVGVAEDRSLLVGAGREEETGTSPVSQAVSIYTISMSKILRYISLPE